MSIQLKLDEALQGFITYKRALGRSPHTIAEYSSTSKKLLKFFGDSTPIASLDRGRMLEFFAWLQDEYKPANQGVAPRTVKKLSQKSIYNIHANLTAFWGWALLEELIERSPMIGIERPRFSPKIIAPYTKSDLKSMLGAAMWSAPWDSDPSVRSARATADRDIAIILVLLDTGIRASELCRLNRSDLRIAKGQIRVLGKGPGGEGKERLVYISSKTSSALWKILQNGVDDSRDHDPVFTVGSHSNPRRMSRTTLWKLVARIGQRAAVEGANPHRFRHTFAISYLRNGGDLFTLKALLGHSDLAMVQRYARIARTDSENAHRSASPVARWNL